MTIPENDLLALSIPADHFHEAFMKVVNSFDTLTVEEKSRIINLPPRSSNDFGTLVDGWVRITVRGFLELAVLPNIPVGINVEALVFDHNRPFGKRPLEWVARAYTSAEGWNILRVLDSCEIGRCGGEKIEVSEETTRG